MHQLTLNDYLQPEDRSAAVYDQMRPAATSKARWQRVTPVLQQAPTVTEDTQTHTKIKRGCLDFAARNFKQAQPELLGEIVSWERKTKKGVRRTEARIIAIAPGGKSIHSVLPKWCRKSSDPDGLLNRPARLITNRRYFDGIPIFQEDRYVLEVLGEAKPDGGLKMPPRLLTRRAVTVNRLGQNLLLPLLDYSARLKALEEDAARIRRVIKQDIHNPKSPDMNVHEMIALLNEYYSNQLQLIEAKIAETKSQGSSEK